MAEDNYVDFSVNSILLIQGFTGRRNPAYMTQKNYVGLLKSFNMRP